MKSYPAEHWQALGDWVASARAQAGYSDTKKWAAVVSRSTRQVLGLERGESVGPKTIEAVAEALGIAAWPLFDVLDTGRPLAPWGELKAAADSERRQEEVDRRAMASPAESTYWTRPQGDEADEPVTWGHMEDRLGELEERIARLERSVLRVIAERGGDGNDVHDAGSSAASQVPEVGPAEQPTQIGLAVAADEDTRDIEDEQGHDEHP